MYIVVPPSRGLLTSGAFLKPSLKMGTVSPELIETLKTSETRTMAAWARILADLAVDPCVSTRVVNDDASYLKADELRSQDSRQEAPPPMASKRMTFEVVGKLEGLGPEDQEEVLNNVVSDWKVFRGLVTSTNEDVEEFGKELEALQAMDLPAVEEKVGRVHASFGTIPSNYDAPATLLAWGTIAALGSELTRQAAALLRLDVGAQGSLKTQTAMGKFVKAMQPEGNLGAP
jgi:hypothetical protein